MIYIFILFSLLILLYLKSLMDNTLLGRVLKFTLPICLLIGMFRPFILNVIIDRLGLMSAFYVFPGFCLFDFIFLPSCGLLEHLFVFLFYLVFSVSELSIRIFFSGCSEYYFIYIYIYTHNLSQSIVIILPVWMKYRNLNSLYDLLFSSYFWYNFLKYFLYLHLETKQCYKVVTKNF